MGAVELKWNREFWGECMHSPEMASALQSAAEGERAKAEARIGAPSRKANLRNPDFVSKVVTRHGKSSDYYVGLVIAANPRSIYKAKRGEAF